MAALDQLARLHVETSEASRLVKFLRSSVHAASLFMLMGACVLFLGGGPTIGQNFSWAVLVLIGVMALLYSYIRTNAAVFDRTPVSEAARNLRAIFFYMGLAWGAGAFLAVACRSSDPAGHPVRRHTRAGSGAAAERRARPCGLSGARRRLAVAAAFARSWPHAGLDICLILVLQWGPFARHCHAPPIPSSRGARVALNSCGACECRGSIIGTE